MMRFILLLSKCYKISDELMNHLLTRCDDALDAYDDIIDDPERGYPYAAGFYKATTETLKIMLESTIKYAEEIKS